MSRQLLQTTCSQSRNLFKFLPLFSQCTFMKNGLVKQIPYCTFTLLQQGQKSQSQFQSLALILADAPKICESNQNGNSGNGENRSSFSNSRRLFLISALLVCHCADEKGGEIVFSKKEFWFFHYFLRSTGRRTLRQGANDKRDRQPFGADTVSQILAIIKEGDEIKDLNVKVLDQLIIYAEEVIQNFDKKLSKSKSSASASDKNQTYAERTAQWKEILQLLQQRRDAKK